MGANAMNPMNSKCLHVLLLLLTLAAAPVQAQAMPDELVRTTTDKIQALLKQNHALYKKDTDKLYAMVYEHILPHFDFRAMSKLVLARNWRGASEDQRTRFAGEFRDLLVRTYATALLNYTDEEIIMMPFRASPGDKRVEVKTEVKRSSGGPNIPLYYRFYKKDEKAEWKVYDVSIDGISMVTNYRSVYADKIRKQGLDALIASMASTGPETVKPAPK